MPYMKLRLFVIHKFTFLQKQNAFSEDVKRILVALITWLIFQLWC